MGARSVLCWRRITGRMLVGRLRCNLAAPIFVVLVDQTFHDGFFLLYHLAHRLHKTAFIIAALLPNILKRSAASTTI